jgi:hypothetical protein
MCLSLTPARPLTICQVIDRCAQALNHRSDLARPLNPWTKIRLGQNWVRLLQERPALLQPHATACCCRCELTTQQQDAKCCQGSCLAAVFDHGDVSCEVCYCCCWFTTGTLTAVYADCEQQRPCDGAEMQGRQALREPAAAVMGRKQMLLHNRRPCKLRGYFTSRVKVCLTQLLQETAR